MRRRTAWKSGSAPFRARGGGENGREELSEARLVQSDEMPPGPLGVGGTVDRAGVVGGHVRDAPTVLGRIDFNFRRNVRGSERLAQLVFGVGLALVVIRRDAEIHSRFDP